MQEKKRQRRKKGELSGPHVKVPMTEWEQKNRMNCNFKEREISELS